MSESYHLVSAERAVEFSCACAEVRMRSSITKRSVTIRGHKTSVTLEDIFWQSLREIAVARNVGLSMLLDEIDGGRQKNNLSSHIRMFVLEYFRKQCGADDDAGARKRAGAPRSADPN